MHAVLKMWEISITSLPNTSPSFSFSSSSTTPVHMFKIAFNASAFMQITYSHFSLSASAVLQREKQFSRHFTYTKHFPHEGELGIQENWNDDNDGKCFSFKLKFIHFVFTFAFIHVAIFIILTHMTRSMNCTFHMMMTKKIYFCSWWRRQKDLKRVFCCKTRKK